MSSETETKVCTRCKQALPLSDFWISDKARGYRASACKPCTKARLRERYAAKPEARAAALANSRKQALAKPRTAEQSRRYNLKTMYGIAHGHYDTMLAAQGGRCALCGSADCGRTAGKWSAGHFMVDHDHATGRVRGLLCHKCNVRVGAYEGLLADVGVHKLVAYLSGASPDAPPAAQA